MLSLRPAALCRTLWIYFPCDITQKLCVERNMLSTPRKGEVDSPQGTSDGPETGQHPGID